MLARRLGGEIKRMIDLERQDIDATSMQQRLSAQGFSCTLLTRTSVASFERLLIFFFALFFCAPSSQALSGSYFFLDAFSAQYLSPTREVSQYLSEVLVGCYFPPLPTLLTYQTKFSFLSLLFGIQEAFTVLLGPFRRCHTGCAYKLEYLICADYCSN